MLFVIFGDELDIKVQDLHVGKNYFSAAKNHFHVLRIEYKSAVGLHLPVVLFTGDERKEKYSN